MFSTLRLARTLVPAAVAVAALCVFAFSAAPRVALAAAGGDELHDTMEKVDGIFRELYKQVQEPDRSADSLKKLVEIQGLILKVKSLEPPKIEQVIERDRIKLVRDFRLRIVELLAASLEVEKALLEERHEAAFEALKKMRALRDEGHRAFDVED